MPSDHSRPTFNRVALGELIYEFGPSDHPRTEKRMQRRAKSLPAACRLPGRLALLRRFKDAVQRDIHQFERSTYFVGHIPKERSRRRLADLNDFDRGRMIHDYKTEFPRIARDDIEWFVTFAIYMYYLR